MYFSVLAFYNIEKNAGQVAKKDEVAEKDAETGFEDAVTGFEAVLKNKKEGRWKEKIYYLNTTPAKDLLLKKYSNSDKQYFLYLIQQKQGPTLRFFYYL